MENSNSSLKQMIKLIAFGILLYCGIEHYELLINLFSYLISIIFPFILGGIIAFIVNVPMRSIERHLFIKVKAFDSFRRVCAYLLTLLLIAAVFALALFVIIPEVGNTIMVIIDQVPIAFRSFQEWFNQTTSHIPNVQKYLDTLELDWNSISSHAVNIIKDTSSIILTSGFGIIGSIIGGVTTFVIAFTFSIYLIFQKEKLSSQIKQSLYALFNEKRADRVIYIGTLSNRIFSSFLSGQCIEAVILGTMFFITLNIFQLPYALLIGVIIAITALIPIFGAFIGCGVGIFLIVMVNPIQALWFVIIFLILQQVEGNLIYPYVVGGSIGLPSIWVLFAVTVGVSLLGIAGILLFIPLCSVFYSLFRDYVKERLELKQIDQEKWEKLDPCDCTIAELDANKKPSSKADTQKGILSSLCDFITANRTLNEDDSQDKNGDMKSHENKNNDSTSSNSKNQDK